ncbi:hypothetical protein NQ315_015127, partial [Exocentrus adspersus]
MLVKEKRIFIQDFPETVTEEQLRSALNSYGNVTAVDIKERKELGLKNTSLFFAYVNVQIDDKKLQECFRDFTRGKWFDQHIALQIARESFLDRLKREREDTEVSKKDKNVDAASSEHRTNELFLTNVPKKRKIEGSTKCKGNENEKVSVSPSGKDVKDKKNHKTKSESTVLETAKEEQDYFESNETLNIVIKNNKGKIDTKNLKIESVGKSPVAIINKSKSKPDVNTSESNLKRLQSLSNFKKTHKAQKSLIQQALSNIDGNSTRKIIFDDTDNTVSHSTLNQITDKAKLSLFDDEPQEDDFEPNFETKEQFQGEHGQKLLELQTRYKNDKRFTLDARFLESEEQNESNFHSEDPEELSLLEEKEKEYEILGDILGKRVSSKLKHKTDSKSEKKVMLRFDPTQPEHAKFELKTEAKKAKSKDKRDKFDSDKVDDKRREETEAPQPSKEVFYKVTEDLKDSFKGKQEFSLLGVFGRANEEGIFSDYLCNIFPDYCLLFLNIILEQPEENDSKTITSIPSNFMEERNPFRYDSSDDEDETDNVLHKEKTQQVEISTEVDRAKPLDRNSFWSEPFFLLMMIIAYKRELILLKKMCTKDDSEFIKLRRNVKEIVRAKVRNNQRKNRPFKKKLGGNKKRKMLRIKKSLEEVVFKE